MNERIRELAEQAKFMAEEDINRQISYNAELKVFAEKFAELIVQECAVYCAGHILTTKMAEENDLNYNDGIMDCAIGLKQHFGVEE